MESDIFNGFMFHTVPDSTWITVVITTAVSRSPFSGVADNNKFFCGWQKMGVY
jgi:hypothetical protein